MSKPTKNKPLGIDACCGLKGASQAWLEMNWEVLTLDIEPSFKPDIITDLRTWSYHGRKPTLMWFSPPCDEFARESMPWSKTGRTPDLSIYEACRRIIKESQPLFWVIENVRGAQPYFGPSTINYGAFHLWTNMPLAKFNIQYRKKESYGSKQKAERAKVPYKISRVIAETAQSTIQMFTQE
jgi:hypothetical protein